MDPAVAIKKGTTSSSLHEPHHSQQQEQIPNRSVSNRSSISSHLIPPVKTNRSKYQNDEDGFTNNNKNIGSDYQDIQIRTLTKWMNVQLSKVNDHIDHIESDLKDGTKLLKLLSVVSSNGSNLKPERGHMRIHELSNVAQTLKFLQDQWGVDNSPAIASEAIVNGDVKSTLAITFFIMLKYQIQPILSNEYNDNSKMPPPLPLPTSSTSRINPTSGKASMIADAKFALLYWVRTQLIDYVQSHIIATVQDFSRSWRSGLAFCLLLHRFNPAILPNLFSSEINSDKEILLSLAFDVAFSELNIPKYLEPADMLVDYPHEPSVMMYVSEMYKIMSKEMTKDAHRDQRIKDIKLVAEDDLIEQALITPPNSTTNDELPNTPQPEQLFEEEVKENEDTYQQLDELSFMLSSENDQDLENADQLFENTRLVIDRIQDEEERQALTARYNQLKSTWEDRSRKLEPLQHELHNMNHHSSIFIQQLKQIIPKSKTNTNLHPLDGSFEIAQEFEQSLNHIVTTHIDSLDKEEEQYLVQVRALCVLFNRSASFGQLTSAINDELDVIQQLMTESGNRTVTDDLIQGLVQRIHVVNTTIQGVREEFGHDLLTGSSANQYFLRFITCIDDTEDRYEIVRDWVDQVRVWFVEAERIRAWIDKHIQIINSRNKSDKFDPISPEVTIEDAMVISLHEEHERLKQEIDHFDSDDMDRLRGHVKLLTHNEDNISLTPADTSTIEITFTTLNMLNQLTQLLNKRSHLIQLLLLRVKWEDLFGNAVQWIAQTDGVLDPFLRGKARWSEKEESNYSNHHDKDEGDIESIIKTLVSLERKIADFDCGTYSDVLDAYQEMEALPEVSLPDYLEMRQLGFEKAFEDLMKRSSFSRKIVEQLLSMVNIVEKFKELRDVGEQLRQVLLKESSLSSSNMMDDDLYAEKVQAFKEESARLITNASTCVPYPDAPQMSTAMGANDTHDNEVTNEVIKSTISNYSMSLALIADGLDQLLTARYQVFSLQQRSTEAFDAMKRVQTWIDERIKLLEKSRFDIMLYSHDRQPDKNSSSGSNSSNGKAYHSDNHSSSLNGNATEGGSPTVSHATGFNADDEDLLKLEKEHNSIAQRLQQLENEDLIKLYETVRALEYDVDASNAISIDRDTLIDGVESLEKSHQTLATLLAHRSLELDALKRRIDWESQWSKSNSHLQTIARKLCDFNVKKARYDPSKENIDKPSYHSDHENMQSLQFLQDRVLELGERHLSTLAEMYQNLINSYARLENSTLPDFIDSKQSDIKFKYDDLRHLSSYTNELLNQRSTITEFLMRSQDAQHEGEKIKDLVSKKTRRIMAKEADDDATLETHVKKFKEEINSIWEECGKTMAWPVYNGNWLRSHQTTASPNSSSLSTHHEPIANNNTYRSQVRASIKALLDKKMEELRALEKTIDQYMDTYRDADRMKVLVTQYEVEAQELGRWIDTQIQILKSQHVDVSAESFLARGMNIADLEKSRVNLNLEAEFFQENKVKALHDRIAQLVEESVQKKKNQSIDVTSAARNLGEVMNHLSQLKQGLADQAVTLEAATMRSEWENNLQVGVVKLEEMNDQLRQFTAKKNQWVVQDDLTEEHVQTLQQDLAKLVAQKNKFEKSVLPGIQLSYDAFVEYFPKLSRPMATPDHLEARMESLSRTSARFQENVAARSKELDLIKQRIRWEDVVKQALAFLSQKEALIEFFIEEKARWQNDTSQVDSLVHDDDEESKLRTAWSEIYNDVSNHEQNVIAPLKEGFEKLVNKSTDHYNNTSVTLLPNAFMKKMQDVELAQSRADYYLTFSNEIVSQRCLVSAFILRTVQLEQSAELIREEFIATKVAAKANNIAGLLETHSERLEKFKSGIEDVRQNLGASIPYPVRSLENVSTQAKLKDETTNSVIQETIGMRNAQLDELCSSLQQLLESKERVSRRRLSLHSYKKQAKATEAWIESRYELLSSFNLLLTDDLEKLKEAVSQAESVDQAMKANETVLTALKSAFEKCTAAFNDISLDSDASTESEESGQESLVQEVASVVKPTQKRIEEAWNALLVKTNSESKGRITALIERKLKFWLEALNNLMADIEKKTADAVLSDDQMTFWMNQFTPLENKEYQNLSLEVEANQSLLDKQQTENSKSMLEEGVAIAQTIKGKLNDAQNELYLNQLVSKYLSDISKLQEIIGVKMNQLTSLKENYQCVDHNVSCTTRQSTYQCFVSEFNEAIDGIHDLRDSYEDISTQHSTILNKKSSFEDSSYTAISQSWSDLETKGSDTATLVSRVSKWVKHYSLLASLQKELESAQHDLLNNSEGPDENSFLEKIGNQLTVAERQLTGELQDLAEELLQDPINLKPFEIKRSASLELLGTLKLMQNDKLKAKEKSIIMQFIDESIKRLHSDCTQRLEFVNQHMSKYNFSDLTETDVDDTVNACFELIDANHATLMNAQNELDSLRYNQCARLLTEFDYSEEEVGKLFIDIVPLLDNLEHATQSEKECSSLAKLLSQHIQSVSSIALTIEESTKQLATDRLEEYISDLERQSESLDDAVLELYRLGETIKTYPVNSLLQFETRTRNVTSIVEKNESNISQKLDEFKKKLKESRHDIDKSIRRRQIISKLHDTIRFIADTTERINKLQLTGKGVVSEELEFEDVCKDFDDSIAKRMKAINALIEDYEDMKSDQEINQLFAQIDEAVKEINALINIKKKTVSEEGDLSEFFHIMDKFDEQVSQLLAAIDNASPHHSTMIGGKFVKSDLQALLKSLVAAYKHHKEETNKTLSSANAEFKKQYLNENKRVSELLQKATRRWSIVQSSAASRERELQACISNLDHEFFTKLAIAKSSPKPVRKTMIVTPLQRHGSPSKPIKTSRTPSVSTSSSAGRLPLRASYIPDPKNALDIELSNIVNTYPYRVTVKSIPGQVGKYWFGDENPKLVYCRILPSQLVMVRVGGGWVEFSKFLREHGLTEALYSRPGSSIGNQNENPQASFQESYLHTLRSSSPSGKVTIRGGGGAGTSNSLASTRSSSKSSGSRSRSPLPGFVDGENFISIDEAGNHVVVKMKKAETDAKTPVINKKKY